MRWKISWDGRKDGRTEVKQYSPPPVERGYKNVFLNSVYSLPMAGTELTTLVVINVKGYSVSRHFQQYFSYSNIYDFITLYYHWVDTSAGGLFFSEGMIRPVVIASTLTWRIRYTSIYYWNIQFLNNVPLHGLLGGWNPSLLIVQQHRYQPSDSNKNVDIKFSAPNVFLE